MSVWEIAIFGILGVILVVTLMVWNESRTRPRKLEETKGDVINALLGGPLVSFAITKQSRHGNIGGGFWLVHEALDQLIKEGAVISFEQYGTTVYKLKAQEVSEVVFPQALSGVGR